MTFFRHQRPQYMPRIRPSIVTLAIAFIAYNTLISPNQAWAGTSTDGGNCDISDNSEYFEISILNHTNKILHLDLGDPKHGVVERYRYISVDPHTSLTTSACSDGFLTGLETYVRLYNQHYHYLEEWYVKQPFIGENTVTFHNDSGVCTVKYQLEWLSHGYVQYGILKPEPATIHTHDFAIAVQAECN